MNFPKQVRQHKNESDSFAIILYKLRELGIFRNVTSQDYGIDFEIELVEDGQVTGHCIKVQVKSSETLRLGKKKNPKVGGIKQTTLRYWAELSYSVPVIALCVDLKTETVYLSKDLFWTSICQLDATEKSKSISFLPKMETGDLLEVIRRRAHGYSLREELLAHKWLVRNLRAIFEMYCDSFCLDAECQNIDEAFFKAFLDNVRVFLTPITSLDNNTAKAFEQLFSYDYYYKKSGLYGLYNRTVYEGLKCFFLLFLNTMIFYRVQVFKSGYYWAYYDDDYLKLVLGTEIPHFKDETDLRTFNYDDFYSREPKSGWFARIVSDIEKNAKCKNNELQEVLLKKHGYLEL